MSAPGLIVALRRALEADPHNGPLWIHLAELEEAAGDPHAALSALRSALELEGARDEAERRLIPLLRRTGRLAEALLRIERRLAAGDDPELRRELSLVQDARGQSEEARSIERELERAEAPAAEPPGERKEALAGVAPEPDDPDDWVSQFDWGDLRVTFEDVVGLEEVKRQIRLRIIAPFQNPEVYRAFGREGGGGLLLYGPPGCGKTYVARATAGELSARFVSVSIHDVLDKFWGESEKLVHALFEDARRKSPTVLFFDEFDALGSSRGTSDSQFWRVLVDQLLHEMDGMGGRNRDVLLFAATNTPWNVDAAFRRPGRFDRVLFVPPPDAPARQAILARHCAKLPGGEALDLAALARATELFTGADLKHLCERAAEDALERSLETGKLHAVSQRAFQGVLREHGSTALEWLATARNYARYSNEGGQYDELVGFLKAAKRW